MKTEKKPAPMWAVVVGVSVLALFIVALVAGQSPAEKAKDQERDAIAYCWKEQGRKSMDPSLARFVAGTCERMEAEYLKKHGRPP